MKTKRPRPSLSMSEYPSYKGGYTRLSTNGYVLEFCFDHHLGDSQHMVGQHRLVAEDKLGRRLVQSDDPTICEVAHHRDECPTNNHPDNIEVMTRQAHIELHGRLAAERNAARVTPERVAEALRGRTIKQAARLLQTDQTTLRERFPDLMVDRIRKSPEKLDDEALVAQIRLIALCPLLGHAETAKAVGIGRSSLLRLIERYDIPWRNQTKAGQHMIRFDQTDPKMVAFRKMAADPEIGVYDIQRMLGYCPRTTQRLLGTYDIPWTGKPKSGGRGKKRETYGGKPTRAALAARASGTEPGLL